jgi:hypothetical protein
MKGKKTLRVLVFAIRLVVVFLLSTLSYLALDLMIWGSYIDYGSDLEGAVAFLLVIITRAVMAEGSISMIMGVKSFDSFEFRFKNLGVAALLFGPPLFTLLFLLRVTPSFYMFLDQSKLPEYPYSLLWMTIYGALLYEFPRLILFYVIEKKLLMNQFSSLKISEINDDERDVLKSRKKDSSKLELSSTIRFLVVLFLSILTLHFLDVYIWAFLKRTFDLEGIGIFALVVLVRAIFADWLISGIVWGWNPKNIEFRVRSLALAGITFGVPLVRLFNILERYVYLYVSRSFSILGLHPLSVIFVWVGSALLYEFPRLMLFLGIKKKILIRIDSYSHRISGIMAGESAEGVRYRRVT